MSGIQSKIIRHIRRQESITNNEQTNQPIETDLEPLQILEQKIKTLKQLF